MTQISLAGASLPANQPNQWSGILNASTAGTDQLIISTTDSNGSCSARIDFNGSTQPSKNITVAKNSSENIDIPSDANGVSVVLTNEDSTQGFFRIDLWQYS